MVYNVAQSTPIGSKLMISLGREIDHLYIFVSERVTAKIT